MGNSKIANGLERFVNNTGRLVGELQLGVNKILWGRGNTQPSTTVQLVPPSGSQGSRLNYTTNTPTAPQTAQQSKFRTFAESGVFNILNALNSVDLCNVLTYAYDNVKIRKGKRPPREEWGPEQRIFYGFQDACGKTVKYIDKYTAYPNVFIGSYVGIGPNAIPPLIAAQDTAAPVGGGTQVQKYNTYFLMQAIKQTLTFGTSTGSLFTPEDAQTMQAVPGLVNNINFLRDSVDSINNYTDYRQISDINLQKLIDKVNKIRTVCVTVQNLDLRDPKGLANLAGNYLGFDIRNQIQQLQKYIDVTKIIPTLKQVNNALRGFIAICNQVQKIVTLAQFIIKLGLLFYKIFKFVIKFFENLPAPSVFLTAGIQITLQKATTGANNEADGVVRVLKAVNGLLAVVVSFIKYLLANTVELLRRLETLLAVLRTCETMKDSDVLFELEETYKELEAVKEQLEAYIIQFEGKTDPNTAEFGAYQIRVEEEQLVETGIVNRRRRGIALDKNGRIAAQSDLTFATNEKIIIEEVKQKLVSLGLINPILANLDTANLAVISESLNYLDTNDVLDDDLNITEAELDDADNLDENQGLGLQAFINNLKGGRRLRRRMREQMAKNKRQLATQLQREDPSGRTTGNLTSNLATSARQDEIKGIRTQIDEWKAQIAAAALLPPNPVNIALIRDRTIKIQNAQKRIRELGG
jgi:hypothetical protein